MELITQMTQTKIEQYVYVQTIPVTLSPSYKNLLPACLKQQAHTIFHLTSTKMRNRHSITSHTLCVCVCVFVKNILH